MSTSPLMTGLVLLFSAAVAIAVVLTSGSAAERKRGVEAEPAVQAPAAGLPSAPIVRLHLSLDEPLRAVVLKAAAAVAGEMGVELQHVASADEATLTAGGAAGESSMVVERWLPVASLWSTKTAVTFDGNERLVLPEDRRVELVAMLGGAALADTVAWTAGANIESMVAADTGLASLLPVEWLPATPLRRLALGDGEPWLEQRVGLAWHDGTAEEFAGELRQRVEGALPPLTTIAFTGDIIPARCVYARHRDLGDYTAAFHRVAPDLLRADIRVGSLDASISDAGTPYACEETFNLLAPPRSVEGLAFASFDVLTLATNHAMDCGSTGIGCYDAVLDTIAHLQGAGIATVGAGADLAAARNAAVLEANGVRFAFLGYDDIAAHYFGATATSPGTALLDEAWLREDIESAVSVADVVIVLPQWGAEYTPHPTDRQLRLGRAALAAGATLVVGNHPHVVQGVEADGGAFIAYALGNFVFDQDWSLETQQGAVLEATFAGSRLVAVTLRPVRIWNMFQPAFADAEEAGIILERMQRSSQALGER